MAKNQGVDQPALFELAATNLEPIVRRRKRRKPSAVDKDTAAHTSGEMMLDLFGDPQDVPADTAASGAWRPERVEITRAARGPAAHNGDSDTLFEAAAKHKAPRKKADDDQPLLFEFALNIDIHLHSPSEAVVNIAGPEPERAVDALARMCSGLRAITPRRVAFPTRDLDRFLCVKRPSRVTLDAGALCVGRALWARALTWRPLVVRRDGQRLIASSPRWPVGWRIVDAPWTAIAALDHMEVPFTIDESARTLLAKRLADAGQDIATAGLTGNAISIVARQPDLLEAMELPALGYAGPAGTGRYRLPLLASEPLLTARGVKLSAEATRAIKRANAPIRNIVMPDGFPWTLYKFQTKDLSRAVRIIEHTGGVLLAGDMGAGKSCRWNTPVATPNGWTAIGDLTVGDLVFAPDGKAYPVTGVYPQGSRPLWRVTFTDGTTVDCDDEHLWAVTSAPAGVRGDHQILALKTIRQKLYDDAGNLRYYIPMTQAVHYLSGDSLPVNPYLLGVLLGSDTYTTRDELARNGLHNCGEGETIIPSTYMRASVSDRTALLQGLMDMAGRVESEPAQDGTSITYISPSEQLASDIRELIESLGGTARTSTQGTQHRYPGEQRAGYTSWRLHIALPDDVIAFQLDCKREAYQSNVTGTPARGITNVEPAGYDRAVCITIDSPDNLFMLNGYVPTHNTTIALGMLEHLDLWPALVVAPLAAFSTWARQLDEMGRSYYTATEQMKTARVEMAKDWDAVIISYDRLHAFIPEIEAGSWKVIIADEIQRIRTPGSRRSRALRGLASGVPMRMGLSGTPITNRVEELLPLGSFLVPGEWKPRLTARDLDELYPGHDPEDAIAEHLGTMMVRRRMEDTGVKLPGRHVKRVYVPLTSWQRQALHDLEEDAKRARDDGELTSRMHVFARLQRMRQVINVPSAAGVEGPNPKVKAAVELIEEFSEQGRKAVVFVAERPAWREVGQALDAAGIKWTGIWGSTPIAERIANEERFHKDDSIRAFVGTLASCSEALTLSPTATVTIFASLSYSPAAIAQAAARSYRMNQTNDVDEIYLHAESQGGTLDDRMTEILEIKRRLFAKIVDRTDYKDPALNVSYGDLLFMLTGEEPEKPEEPQIGLEFDKGHETELEAAANELDEDDALAATLGEDGYGDLDETFDDMPGDDYTDETY